MAGIVAVRSTWRGKCRAQHLAARNDEGLIALGNPLPEVAWSTTPRPFDPVTGPSFIDAQAAVDPPQAIPAPRCEQTRHNVTREWMLLFLHRFPMRRVGVLLLLEALVVAFSTPEDPLTGLAWPLNCML